MKRRTFLSTLLMSAGGAAVDAQVRRVQPLLGVGQTQPAPAASTGSSDEFFNGEVLQEVRLDINARDLEALKENFLSNDYYPCDFHFGSETVRNIGIRSRGTASRSGIKPGLRVDFDRYDSDQTFRGLKAFVLRNNTTDVTNMRERISMLFFGRMGLNAPREAHSRLFVNGEYAGLYGLVENIDKTYLNRTLGENDGYLYKFDRNIGDPPYYFNYYGFDPGLYVPHPFKPETHESDPHPEPIRELIRIITEANDANFRSAIAPYIDVTKFMKHVAIEVFLQETDGFVGEAGINNFYIYRPPDRNLHIIIPWDKSGTLETPDPSIFHNVGDVGSAQTDKLVARAIKYDDLKNVFLDTILACADSAQEGPSGDPRGWIEREVDREFQQIVDAVLTDTKKPYTNDQFVAALDDLRKFARQRGLAVRAEVEAARADV
jgi:spore coat protein CotH